MQEIKLMKTDGATREALLNALTGESEGTNKSTKWNPLREALNDVSQDREAIVKSIDDHYFDSYGQFEIHREMLGDRVSSSHQTLSNARFLIHTVN